MNNRFCVVFLLNFIRFEITIYGPLICGRFKVGQIVPCLNEIGSSSAEAQFSHSQYQRRWRRSDCHALCSAVRHSPGVPLAWGVQLW